MLAVLAPEKANWAYVRDMEGRIPRDHGASASEIPGARSLLVAVTEAEVPWAIVTSGTVPLVSGWIERLDLPRPPVLPRSVAEEKDVDADAGLVTAESVANGKPDPECYVLGRERIGLAAEGDAELLVLEDSPAGIRAGKAAGCRVLGLVTSHSLEQVLAAGPDWVVKDLDSVRVVEVVDVQGDAGKEGDGTRLGRRKVVLEFRGLLGGTAVDGLAEGAAAVKGTK